MKALEPPPDSGKPGWLYCALSHIAILESAREQGLPHVIVLEDDTLLSEHFDRGFPPVLAWLESHPELWDLFNGNPSDVNYVPQQSIEQVCSEPLLVRYQWGWMTNFMVYNRSSYDRVIALKDRYLNPTPEMLANYYDHAFDRLLCVAGMRNIATLPYVSIQSKGFSDLESKEVDYDPWVLENGQEFIRQRLANRPDAR